MVVAVGDQRLEAQGERLVAAKVAEADIGCVGAMLHPDPLLDQGLGAGESGDGDGAGELPVLQVRRVARDHVGELRLPQLTVGLEQREPG
jgi:hypothetical protein